MWARMWRPSLRGGVLVASGLLVLGMAVAIAVSAADHLRRTATDSALTNAEAIVRGYVDPILTEASLSLGAQPAPAVGEQLSRLVASGDMRRINVLTRDGRIMYSTEPGLRGQRRDIGHSLATAFGGDSIGSFGTADPTNPTDAALPDRFLEIYVPIRGSSDANPIGVFEVFVDARPIEDDVDATRRDVFLISVATGAALLALLALAFGGASRRLTVQNRRLVQLNDRLNVMTGDLQQSEARFRSLVQNSSDVVVVLDMVGAILYESDAVRRVLGHPPESRLGRAFADGLHPEDRPRLHALLASLGTIQGSQQTADFRLVHADGTWRWVEAIGLNLSNDPAVGGLVLNFRDVTERKRLEDQLQHEAFHDPLTGLANRALFADRVTHALARISRNGHERLAVLFVDLDDFKVVNDSLGHAAGDGLLMAMAERIRACLRRQDTPARLGGDEFGILLEETDAQTAEQIAHRILEAISQPFAIAGRQIFAQASIGIDLDGRRDAPVGGSTAEELLRNADAAMYTAKARGKGRVEFFESGMHASALRRLELRSRLEAALEAGDFVLHYQPVVDLVSGEWAGVEALVRWRQEDGRLLPPDEFIPLAEESGLIVALGAWVLREASHQAARLMDAVDDARLSMAVNVSSRQLQDGGFIQIVKGALTDSGVPAELLILELTESALLADEDAAAAVIGELKQLGVRISLDDFGTGYSSLSHLRRFPIDVLKIDRSFVTDIDAANSGERALVHSIVRLAHSLNLETVAEGVERPEQVVRLRAIGAQYGQGYHFARPMDAAALLRTYKRRRRAAS